ncbi:afadin- and alpha-actinin-binding protein-like isoform X2 [Oryzias latipes]|uniref:afadin- and alpha-actinin-binding protein-like isoform X2 n=1 Tax=Oryzias latipes TaxID=8090 RepID=UPI0005CC525C|nr:afadin- and alpha-actinin-binding protein-like isoform X2 [Oryzias latipes]
MMPESSLVKDHYGISVKCGAPLLRHFNQSSLPLHGNTNAQSAFCTQQNVPECLSHINQEVSSLGLRTIWTELDESSDLNVVTVLNCMHDLIQLHRRSLRTLENMEVEQLKSSSKLDYLQLSTTRLKEQLECSKRENTGLLERERQLQQKVKSLQNCLKNEKEEMQKLQNMIASRATQYNHDMKRKERDLNKLKERLSQLLVDKKERKQAIDVLNNIGRADGKRSVWKTEKTEAKHEGEMYKTLLSDYDARQRDLVLENAELRRVLHQVKNDMVSLLRLKKLTQKGVQNERDGTQANSEEEQEEEGFEPGKELFSVHASEKLTNSIRLQWRRLKSHVEQLDSQVSLAQVNAGKSSETTPRETQEEEVDKLKLEIQEYKDLIQTQQHLLQHQLSSSCDEITSLRNDGYMLQEKERLRGEWKTLEGQRSIFERERKNFTEAAIRLSHEVFLHTWSQASRINYCSNKAQNGMFTHVDPRSQERKAFEEDRATWLKHQFLSLSPCGDPKKLMLSNPTGETELNLQLTQEKLSEFLSDSASTPKYRSSSSLSTVDLHHALHATPENLLIKPKVKTTNTEESRNLWEDFPILQELSEP